MDSWKAQHVVLTKSGTLHVMKSMYDRTHESLCSIAVSGGDVIVSSKSNYRIVKLHIQSTELSLLLKFSSGEEFANWLRAIADFTINPSRSAVSAPDATPPSGINSMLGSFRKQPAASQPQDQVQNIRDKGTGHTQDELSSMYGV